MYRVGPTVEVRRPEVYFPGPQTVVVGAGFVCPREECHMPSLIFMELYEEHGQTWAHKPIGQLPRGTAQVMEELGEHLDELRREAWSNHHGGAFRSAVVMARAAVQRGVRQLGGEGPNLYKEIDDLHEKSIITTDLKDWAHEVRLAAAEAAHPEELGSVSEQDAAESLAFMDAFLEYAIALPARRKALRAARQEPEAAS